MWNKITKVVICLFIFIVGLFAGLFCNILIKVFEGMTLPRVFSDTQIRKEMIDRAVYVPENASHLYYAIRGFVDADHYAAFSLSGKKECEKFLKNVHDVDVSAKESGELPEDFIRYCPDSWQDKYRDKNWSLKGKNAIMIKSYYRFMAYVPEESRIYIKVR